MAEIVDFRIGDVVVIHGIESKPELNGQAATIISVRGDRWGVKPLGRVSSKPIALRVSFPFP